MKNEEIIDSKLQEIRETQGINEALADVPSEIEINGKRLKLGGYTIERIVNIDRAVFQLAELTRELFKIRSETDDTGDSNDMMDRIKDLGIKMKEAIVEALYLILNTQGNDIDRDWIENNIDLTPDGNGRKVVQMYQKKCSLLPFLMDLLSSRQF